MVLLEREYQRLLIKKIRELFPNNDLVILKTDSSYMQGIPDLLILYNGKYAFLEVKASKDAERRPNQEYYIDWAQEDSGFGRFVYPQNESVVLEAMYAYFTS